MNRRRKAKIGRYDLLETLGQGTFGMVRKCRDSRSGKAYAMKMIEKATLTTRSMEKIRREIRILHLIDHPHVVHLRETLETKTHICMVMELITGGELFNYIIAHGRVRPRDAQKFFAQIVRGVHYCHTRNIVHRDLKPENLMLDAKKNIKIIDFGLSNLLLPPEKLLLTHCGSPHYTAPEVSSGEGYGPGADVFSLGVILFALLTGSLPWNDQNYNVIRECIRKEKYEIPVEIVTEDASDLIRRMLKPDPWKRATIFEVIRHPWLCGANNDLLNDENAEIEANAFRNQSKKTDSTASPLGSRGRTRRIIEPLPAHVNRAVDSLVKKMNDGEKEKEKTDEEAKRKIEAEDAEEKRKPSSLNIPDGLQRGELTEAVRNEGNEEEKRNMNKNSDGSGPDGSTSKSTNFSSTNNSANSASPSPPSWGTHSPSKHGHSSASAHNTRPTISSPLVSPYKGPGAGASPKLTYELEAQMRVRKGQKNRGIESPSTSDIQDCPSTPQTMPMRSPCDSPNWRSPSSSTNCSEYGYDSTSSLPPIPMVPGTPPVKRIAANYSEIDDGSVTGTPSDSSSDIWDLESNGGGAESDYDVDEHLYGRQNGNGEERRRSDTSLPMTTSLRKHIRHSERGVVVPPPGIGAKGRRYSVAVLSIPRHTPEDSNMLPTLSSTNGSDRERGVDVEPKNTSKPKSRIGRLFRRKKKSSKPSFTVGTTPLPAIPEETEFNLNKTGGDVRDRYGQRPSLPVMSHAILEEAVNEVDSGRGVASQNDTDNDTQNGHIGNGNRSVGNLQIDASQGQGQGQSGVDVDGEGEVPGEYKTGPFHHSTASSLPPNVIADRIENVLKNIGVTFRKPNEFLFKCKCPPNLRFVVEIFKLPQLDLHVIVFTRKHGSIFEIRDLCQSLLSRLSL